MKVFRTRGAWCSHYFPKAHAAKGCGCYPKQQRVIVILPRPGV